ncbi:hypothetical protein H1R20_g967, partial [Candolleomyces eurysporus]
MGLKGSTSTTRDLPDEVKRQHVLDALAIDPAARQGPGSIRENIRRDSKVHLTVKCVRDEMRAINPGGFAARDPSAKKITRSTLTSPGPHAEWSADGHDKLKEIGFPIWGIRDKWSRKWIGLWVVPCNRKLEVVAYCYLTAILDVEGRPRQTTTDCGSETTLIYGLANALAEIERVPMEDPNISAHRFLKSVRNITIERGWVSLRMNVVENIRMCWNAGAHLVNRADPNQKYVLITILHNLLTQTWAFSELVNWLWSGYIQEELDKFRVKMNAHKPRVNHNQRLPTAISPNIAMETYRTQNAEWCLEPTNLELVRQLREQLGGDQLIRFNSPGYGQLAQSVLTSLNLSIRMVTGVNIWTVYQKMLPQMMELVVFLF